MDIVNGHIAVQVGAERRTWSLWREHRWSFCSRWYFHHILCIVFSCWRFDGRFSNDIILLRPRLRWFNSIQFTFARHLEIQPDLPVWRTPCNPKQLWHVKVSVEKVLPALHYSDIYAYKPTVYRLVCRFWYLAQIYVDLLSSTREVQCAATFAKDTCQAHISTFRNQSV